MLEQRAILFQCDADFEESFCRQNLEGRSATFAALLLEAPQCVPFAKRVEIFRCLVDTDKERSAFLPISFELPVNFLKAIGIYKITTSMK